jgi:hypothetical protein
VLTLAGAALLDAAEGHDAEEQGEGAEGAGDDADFGALGERGPAVADARGGLDLFEDGGRVGGAAAVNVLDIWLDRCRSRVVGDLRNDFDFLP